MTIWEQLLFWVGISVQLFGVGLTIVGAWSVWQDVKSSGDHFLGPFVDAWRLVARGVRRFLRRPAPQVVGIASVSSQAVVGRMGAYTSPGALPEGLSVDERIAVIHKQLQDNIGRIYKQMFAMDDDLRKELERVLNEHQRSIEAARVRDEEKRGRAVSAVRMEAYGFFFLTLGTLIQASGSYLGID